MRPAYHPQPAAARTFSPGRGHKLRPGLWEIGGSDQPPPFRMLVVVPNRNLALRAVLELRATCQLPVLNCPPFVRCTAMRPLDPAPDLRSFLSRIGGSPPRGHGAAPFARSLRPTLVVRALIIVTTVSLATLFRYWLGWQFGVMAPYVTFFPAS